MNARKKGAAGARNTAILNARGTWIGFLDSDDILFPESLALRWRSISRNQDIRWIGAEFQLLKSASGLQGKPVFESADRLIAGLAENKSQPEALRIPRPVGEFGNRCMLGIMTVLIERTLILEKGMFNEQLQRAEDYHLWFKCAFDNDLWMIKSAVAFYRIHPGSLTHGNHPKHLHEDTMIKLLLREPAASIHKTTLTKRFDLVMQDHCYFYRGQKIFGSALKTALRWITKRPLQRSAWKELIACGLRVG